MDLILYFLGFLSFLFLLDEFEEEDDEDDDNKRKKMKFKGPAFSIGVITSEMPFPWYSMEPVEDDDEEEVYIPENRFSSGTNDIDRILKGGLPKSQAILLKTPSCDEKDMILFNIMKKNIENQGCVFVGERLRPYLEKFLDKDRFFMVMSGQSSSKGENIINCDMGPTSINLAIARVLMKLKEKEKILILNILSQLLLQDDSGNVSQFLNSLISKARKKNISIIAILNPQMHEMEDVAQLDDIFDSHLEIISREIERDGVLKLKKFLIIKKMPDVNYKEGLHKINIKGTKLRLGD